jgi:polyphosphate kinase
VSDRIRVRSVVGRFLEHSRILYFENGGHPEIYASSADWMPRNLYERAEVVFPIRDPLLRARVLHEILAAYLADNVKAREMRRGGTYEIERPKGRVQPRFSAQQFLVELAEGKRDLSAIPAAPARTVRKRQRQSVR